MDIPIKPNEDEPKKYESFLRTRPASMEVEAVRWIASLAESNKK